MSNSIVGGCLCGAVRYQITAAPIITRLCWCRDCQYWAAGNATVNVCFPSDAITIDGELRDYSSIADSGNVMHRRFCPVCGTHMFSGSDARPHLIFVRAGTLDDPNIAQPAANIWASSAPAWACMNESIPKYDKQPPAIAPK